MNTEERIELKEFVDRYKEIETSIDLMQKSIESLAKKRDTVWYHCHIYKR